MRVGQSRRRDQNERAIVEALRAIGAHVCLISGPGAPDILVRVPGATWGRLYAFEIKSDKGKQTAAQRETQWVVIRSVEEALMAVGISQ